MFFRFYRTSLLGLCLTVLLCSNAFAQNSITVTTKDNPFVNRVIIMMKAFGTGSTPVIEDLSFRDYPITVEFCEAIADNAAEAAFEGRVMCIFNDDIRAVYKIRKP
ncbi:MAG TPA: hypothetical protein EYG18_07345 [Micavibrio sp.]|nr:hypothetical protein [Pseudomonadota bacterium]HIF24593.1 hypothetical protein [Micavibrio sp.]HIL29067.1 hypothetical protein [Micavibrio sp.]